MIDRFMAIPYDLHTCPKCNSWNTSVQDAVFSITFSLHCHACGHAAHVDIDDREVVSDLANAVQTAVLVSLELEAKAVAHAEEIGRLQAALTRAVTALRRLRSY